MYRNREMRTRIKAYPGPESPHEGPCLRYMMYRNRHTGGEGGRGVFKIYDELPMNRACFRYMLNRHRQMTGVFRDEPESPNEDACLRYMMTS